MPPAANKREGMHATNCWLVAESSFLPEPAHLGMHLELLKARPVNACACFLAAPAVP